MRLSTAPHAMKDDTLVIPYSCSVIPCFESDGHSPADALATSLQSYRLHAVITHQGPVSTSGHYRALLMSGGLTKLHYHR